MTAEEAIAIASSKTYEKGANRSDPVAEEFIRDLDDIIAMARWAEENGATRITLEVNW